MSYLISGPPLFTLFCTLLLKGSEIKLCEEGLQEQGICSSEFMPEAIAYKTNQS